MHERCFLPDHHPPAGRCNGSGMTPLRFLPARVLEWVLAWILAWVLASMSTATFADQTYYRWTDDSGNLVMSDRPPERPDIAYETIATQGSSLRRPRPAPAPAAAGSSSGSASAQQSSGAAPGPAPQVAAVERDPELCRQARENLEILEIKPRIRIYNDQGELEYLTPEQIEEEKRRTRLTIETHCER
ncbi:MAG: DUF4124 domain-containing protein [Halieaceae bacterium]|nr:DUF4124 domain-containing protein [Halieaceae bacterium]